jgi:hypothetical protein
MSIEKSRAFLSLQRSGIWEKNKQTFTPGPVGAVSNRGPHPLLGRGVPTRYWEGTPVLNV